jgi:hypothetical protein
MYEQFGKTFIESIRFNMVRWPSGLRRQLKVTSDPLVHQQYAGPKGRGFKSHSHQHLLLSFLLGCVRVGLEIVWWGTNFLLGSGLGWVRGGDRTRREGKLDRGLAIGRFGSLIDGDQYSAAPDILFLLLSTFAPSQVFLARRFHLQERERWGL